MFAILYSHHLKHNDKIAKLGTRVKKGIYSTLNTELGIYRLTYKPHSLEPMLLTLHQI